MRMGRWKSKMGDILKKIYRGIMKFGGKLGDRPPIH